MIINWLHTYTANLLIAQISKDIKEIFTVAAKLKAQHNHVFSNQFGELGAPADCMEPLSVCCLSVFDVFKTSLQLLQLFKWSAFL